MAGITVTEAADFIPEIWHNEALGALIANLQIGLLINRNISPAFASLGDILHIPKRGGLSVNAKAAGSNYTVQNPSSSKVDVTLDQHREVTITVEDPVKAQANQDVLMGYAEDSAIVMSEDIETFLLAFADTFTTSVEGVGEVDIVPDDIVLGRKDLFIQKVPLTGDNLHFIISPKDGASLLTQAKFTSAEQIGDNITVTTGRLRKYFGVNVWENQLVDVDPGTPTETNNFMFHRDALVLASRALPLTGAQFGIDSSVLSMAGYSMRQQIGYDIKAGAMQLTHDMLYGASKLRDEFGVKFIS